MWLFVLLPTAEDILKYTFINVSPYQNYQCQDYKILRHCWYREFKTIFVPAGIRFSIIIHCDFHNTE